MSLRDRLQKAKEQAEIAKTARANSKVERAEHILDKAGLNVTEYSDDELKLLNAKTIRHVQQELVGKGFIKAGMSIGLEIKERAKIGYLSALVDQNWVLMRQNELIIRALEKLADK